jgi:hypothetical protein
VSVLGHDVPCNEFGKPYLPFPFHVQKKKKKKKKKTITVLASSEQLHVVGNKAFYFH